MMNKSGSRLIAWLLALVMILNIAPVTAFAAESETYTPTIANGEIISQTDFGGSNIPNDANNKIAFTIQYVVQGKYLSTGQNILLKN
jgi:hypothetical protein